MGSEDYKGRLPNELIPIPKYPKPRGHKSATTDWSGVVERPDQHCGDDLVSERVRVQLTTDLLFFDSSIFSRVSIDIQSLWMKAYFFGSSTCWHEEDANPSLTTFRFSQTVSSTIGQEAFPKSGTCCSIWITRSFLSLRSAMLRFPCKYIYIRLFLSQQLV